MLTFNKFGFLNFVDINIEKFAGTSFTIAVTEALYFWHKVLSCKLWTFCCFFSEIYMSFINCDIVFFAFNKSFVKENENYIHYGCWYQCYCKWHFYCHFHIVAELTWITWTHTYCIFPFTFDCKTSYGKTKIIPIDLSPSRTQTHIHTTARSFMKCFVKW